MSTTSRGKGLTVAALIAVLVIGFVSFTFIYFGPALCISCPTTVQYNGTGSTHTLKTTTLTSVASQTLTGGGPSWPIGSAATTFTIKNPPFADFGTWIVTLPADSSVGAGSSYVFTSSYSGTAFLNAGNNAGLWTAEGPSMGNVNPDVFNNTYTSTVGAPSACNAASTTNVCKVTWYLNRYYFTVDMKTAGAGLYVACQTTCQSYSSFFGISNKGVYDTAFQSAFQSVYGVMNGAAHLSTGTTLSLQLNLPPLPGGQSNLDVAGIIAAWTATPCTAGSATPLGGGTGSNDLCVTSSGSPAGANLVQSAIHTPLSLYVDPGLTQRYLPNCLTYLNAPSYTAGQLAGACSSSIASSVYTKIDISDFGAGFSQPGSNTFSNCGISSFSSCWTATTPEAVLTVLLDVLTSYHVYQQYPTPAPQTGTSAGSFDGQVIDGSLFWRPGVTGTSICLTDISGCVTGDGAGNFVMPNVPAGQHTYQVSAPGFFTTGLLTISVSTGQVTHLGQIALAEQNPWYNGCWQIVAPAYPGAFQICIPWILIFTGIGGLVLLGVVIFMIYSPGSKVDAAARIAQRLTPTNPLSPRAQRFVSGRIAREIRKGTPQSKAQAIAFSEARKRGFHVPPSEK